MSLRDISHDYACLRLPEPRGAAHVLHTALVWKPMHAQEKYVTARTPPPPKEALAAVHASAPRRRILHFTAGDLRRCIYQRTGQS